MKKSQEIDDRRSEGKALWKMSLAQDSLENRAEAVRLAGETLAIYEQIESPTRRRCAGSWQNGRGKVEWHNDLAIDY